MIVGCIDPFEYKILQIIRDHLPDGWQLVQAQGESISDKFRALAEAEVCFLMAAPLPKEMIEAAPKLCFIQKLGAGLDRIDLDYCRERRIRVAKLFAGNSVPVAEHTLMLMLAASRRLVWLDQATRAGEWNKEEVRASNQHLRGKTIGILGFGAIGRQVSRLLSGFGVQQLYYDPVRADTETEQDFQVSYSPLDELLTRSDILTLHMPLLESTRSLIDSKRLGLMKPTSIVINCARGGLIDERALFEALESRQIFGAGIDAFSQEPPLDSPLLKSRYVAVTPHCAGATIDNFESIVRRAVENTQTVLEGGPLPVGDEEILWPV
ncbi:2-hydroxyacid dehydrogenase [Litorivicinus sp.]|nr:2-hydroxyacid dehydrogenase [Litorivicinus sp.]